MLGFVIGAAGGGQTFYTFVLDNLRHFGRSRRWARATGRCCGWCCLQVLLVGAIGYGIGLGGASLDRACSSPRRAGVRDAVADPGVGGLAVIVCCLIAGGLSMVRVLRLEPAIVFKSVSDMC